MRPDEWRGPLALACTLCAAVLSAGCGSRERPVDAASRQGVLLLGNLSEPKDLDPHVITGVSEFNIVSALLEGLVAEGPQDLAPEPGAAESWSVSDDGTVYTFTLRQNGLWSNGDPVTSADFMFSFRRMLSPELGSPYAYMLFGAKNAEAYHKGSITNFADVGFEAPDSRTVRITLNAPIPYFLSLLAHHSWFPVHQPTIRAHGAETTIGTAWTKPGSFVGNGPFVLKTWEPGNRIEVEVNDSYWDRARVKLNAIKFYPIGDHKIEERAFLAGQLHVTGTVPLDRISYYSSTRPELLRLNPYLGVYYYLFNVTKPPLNDVRVRRALSMSVNRGQIVRYVTKGGEDPAFCFTPPGAGKYSSSARLDEDAAGARALLASAGYPGGTNFPRIALLYNNSDAHARIAQSLRQMWTTQLGIDVELVNMEWKVYLDQTQSLKYDIARAGWIGDYADPNTFLDMWVTGGGNNRTGWSNRQYDILVSQAAAEPNTEERTRRFQQAEAILLEESPVMPIYFYRSKSLVHQSVRGWYSTILDRHPYKHVYLTPGG
ncbi:MAG: peptide ABC transporter substrate-binding protein [Lentisphaerae bacterium]|nr:peptide ABC transporter substrate-binding protein [Lentisphaerota bacterium]